MSRRYATERVVIAVLFFLACSLIVGSVLLVVCLGP
jgi:hypothetical protein